jgi:hypothetical protein
MKKTFKFKVAALVAATLATASHAAVTADEAAKLKAELTPLGAERAGNKDGSIPAWDGVYSTPLAGWKNGERRPDPFAADKLLYSVTASNMAQHESKLTEGVKAMLKKYPSFRLDVFPTRRTAGAPQWVYDNTAKNALRAKIVVGEGGPTVSNAYGGIPFPIPKSAEEIMWNSMMNWKGTTKQSEIQTMFVTADGKRVMTTDARTTQQSPYYDKDETIEQFKGDFMYVRLDTKGPPIRAGEAIVGVQGVNPSDDKTWTYLPGQRRVRRLPNACCDTPTPATAGLASFDELQVYVGRLDRFDWKIVGKKEILVPYNTNRLLVPQKVADVVGDKHLNPDHVRWELHRVWVVDASLAPGKRHVAVKSRYYIDEDSWMALLGERYDAQGSLWKVLWQMPYAVPDMPGVATTTFGFNDLLAGTWYVSGLMNEKNMQMRSLPKLPDTFFNPDALAGEGVR